MCFLFCCSNILLCITSFLNQCPFHLLQFINPAYQLLLGHLRARTLVAFKESFDKALTKEGFAVAARDCTQTFLEKFDKGSEGKNYIYSLPDGFFSLPQLAWAERFRFGF